MPMKLSEIGKQTHAIEQEIGVNLDAVMHKLTQELGEFNDAVQKYRWILSKTKTENLDKVEDEVGDLFFNIISILYNLGINPDRLPEFAENTLHKLEERKNLYKTNMPK